jgi:predicted nuclease of predicted toxin-antitoxin system
MGWRPLPEPSKEVIRELNRSRRARFLVDENVGEGVAEALRGARWNVKFVGEVGLDRHDDSDVFAFAGREGRFIVTHDRDFLDDRRFPPHRNPGIVVLPGGAGEERELLRALVGMLSIIGPFGNIWAGTKVRISAEGEWRVSIWAPATGRHETTRFRFPKHGAPLEWSDGEE